MIAHRLQTLARPEARRLGKGLWEAAPDIVGLQTLLVNLYFVGLPGGANGWVLVDTGLPLFTGRILQAAERRFGPDRPPGAIVLTHGHFDHVGTVRDLASRWDVPVYAHEDELPYLTGRLDYPPPDPGVGGGLLARMASLYPPHGIDLGDRVHPLPADGSIPAMPGWQWIHTPGHTPGHVSLYREADRALLAGDAFVTTKQESALAVMLQYPAVHGPPAYFTSDWTAARESVRKLASLRPPVAATGHGRPMHGEALDRQLQELARDFDRLAIPQRGRYVHPEEAAARERARALAFPSQKALLQVLATAGLAVGTAALVSAVRSKLRGSRMDE